MKFLSVIILCLPIGIARAQVNFDLIQLSGHVVSQLDSTLVIPYVTISVEGTMRQTVSNFSGVFSLIVFPGDTVQFEALGYQRKLLAVNQSVGRIQSSVIRMAPDTILIEKVVIYPWPTPEEFKTHFLNLDPDDPLAETADKNIEDALASGMLLYLEHDGNEIQDAFMRSYAKSFYSAGQMPYMGVFNLFAWAQYFKMLEQRKKMKQAKDLWLDD